MADTTPPGVEAVVSFEDSSTDIQGELTPGTESLLWPLARWPIASALVASSVGTTPSARYRPQPWRVRAQRAVRHALPNPLSSDRAPRAEHLFIVTGWTKERVPGGYENWLTEDFAAALGDDAIVVQNAFLDPLSRDDQRPMLRRTYSYARAIERRTRRATNHPLASDVRDRVELAVQEFFRQINGPALSPEAVSSVIADVVARATAAAPAVEEFSRLLDRVQPRRIYMQAAAYGDKAPLIRLAHSRGIAVSELQHGWIGRSHAAYNFGRAMAAGELQEHLPDTLLTFGEFWHDGLRFPGRCAPIGKPALDRQRRVAPAYGERPRRVLFVSGRFQHDRIEDVSLALLSALPEEWTVAIRPHPSERNQIRSLLPRVVGNPRIEIDDQSDASVAMSSSRLVVGFASTMLYEALAFGCHVAVVESSLADSYARSEIFPLRIDATTDVSHVVAAATAPPRTAETVLSARVWQPHAVAEFLREARG